MKSINQRFDYRRLAEQLVEHGLVDRKAIQHVVQECQSSGRLFTEIIVQESLVSDWEIARICCELFHLPYLPVERYAPAPSALEGLDAGYLRRFCLVPLDRFGSVLTVSMPGVVPTDVLEGLRGSATRVLPVVGSVTTNRKWLEERLPDPDLVAKAAAKATAGKLELAGSALPNPDDGAWANIFDAGEQAVRLDLKGRQGPARS